MSATSRRRKIAVFAQMPRLIAGPPLAIALATQRSTALLVPLVLRIKGTDCAVRK
jgi:hypothetical protein